MDFVKEVTSIQVNLSPVEHFRPHKKWGKKCSNGQMVICIEVTSYKIHTLVRILIQNPKCIGSWHVTATWECIFCNVDNSCKALLMHYSAYHSVANIVPISKNYKLRQMRRNNLIFRSEFEYFKFPCSIWEIEVYGTEQSKRMVQKENNLDNFCIDFFLN